MRPKPKVGDLVRPSVSAHQSLREHCPAGFGCVTKLVSETADTVYVFWYNEGRTKPISRRWLEVIQ